MTPDRARAERRRLAEQAAEAQAAAEAAAARAARLAAVLAFEARERRELGEFAALEHQLLAERERVLTGEAAQWRTDAAAAASQLADVRQRLVDTDARLLQRDDEARLPRLPHACCCWVAASRWCWLRSLAWPVAHASGACIRSASRAPYQLPPFGGPAGEAAAWGAGGSAGGHRRRGGADGGVAAQSGAV